MAWYNITELNTTESFTGLVSNVNDVSNGLLVPVIIITIYIVALITLTYRYDFVTSMRVSGLITTLVSLGFWGSSMLDIKFVLIPSLLVLLSFLFAPILRGLGEE